MKTQTIRADSQDELDDTLEHFRDEGWHVVAVTRERSGEYKAELVKPEGS